MHRICFVVEVVHVTQLVFETFNLNNFQSTGNYWACALFRNEVNNWQGFFILYLDLSHYKNGLFSEFNCNGKLVACSFTLRSIGILDYYYIVYSIYFRISRNCYLSLQNKYIFVPPELFGPVDR